MTVFDTSALVRPLFTDAELTATKWDNAAEKAASANALCRFMSADFRESLFTQKLYRRLALTFGHIAHDAERAVLPRLRKSNLLEAYRALRAAEVEGAERALLAKLREKHEGAPASSQTSAPILHPGGPPKTRRSGQQSGQTGLF